MRQRNDGYVGVSTNVERDRPTENVEDVGQGAAGSQYGTCLTNKGLYLCVLHVYPHEIYKLFHYGHFAYISEYEFAQFCSCDQVQHSLSEYESHIRLLDLDSSSLFCWKAISCYPVEQELGTAFAVLAVQCWLDQWKKKPKNTLKYHHGGRRERHQKATTYFQVHSCGHARFVGYETLGT